MVIDRGPEPLYFLPQSAVPERPLDRESQTLDLEGLRHVVVRAGSDGQNGGLHAAEAGHHDDRNILAVGHDPLAEVDTGHPRHVEVRHDEIEVSLGEEAQARVRRPPARDLEAPFRKGSLEHVTHGLVVVDD